MLSRNAEIILASIVWLIGVYAFWRVYRETGSVIGAIVIGLLILSRRAYYGWLWPKRPDSD
jgi:hypothetical protein